MCHRLPVSIYPTITASAATAAMAAEPLAVGDGMVCAMARNVVMCRAAVKSAVIIRHIYISPGHNFFGRHGRPAGEHRIADVQAVQCHAGFGLEGDRFHGYRPDYNGQVTFFAWETYAAVKRALGLPGLRPDAFRRNIITEGMHLNELIGTRFSLGGINFEGMSEAKPCYWMNEAVGPGAEQWLRGQGGLRAKIISDGELRCGPTQLYAHGLLALGTASP